MNIEKHLKTLDDAIQEIHEAASRSEIKSERLELEDLIQRLYALQLQLEIEYDESDFD